MSNQLKRIPLRITFLLPMTGEKPIGGFKVAYEYANYLAAAGYSVSVIHPAVLRTDQPFRSLGPRRAVRVVREYLRNLWTGAFQPSKWFEISPRVKLLWVPSLKEKYIPEADILIATAWETAEWAQSYGASRGKKFYLIQHRETWSGPEDRVFATWKSSLTKIVIARWLQEIAEDLGQTAYLVHNGLDFKTFGRKTSPELRNPWQVLMIFHVVEWKGTADGMAAFEIARRQIPELKLTLFGLGLRPEGLSAEIEYHANPPQNVICDLYNRSSVYISPSWTEGFPLPPAEALQCGTALAVTDIPGTAMYAIHNETALLSPIKDPEALAANIVRLVEDKMLRLRLAHRGHELIQQFTWERAGEKFEEILRTSLQPGPPLSGD